MRLLVGALAGLVVMAAGCGGSDAAPTATPASDMTATSSVSTSETATATSTSAASPTPTPWDDYVDVVEGEPVPLPEGVVLYYYGYVFSEGIPVDRWLRAHQTSEGLVIRDLARSLPGTASLYSLAANYEGQHLVASLCVVGHCGGVGDPTPDATLQTFESVDGGITWDEVDSPPLGVRFIGALDAFRTPVGIYSDYPGGPTHWISWPDGGEFEPPLADARASVVGGELLWEIEDEELPHRGGIVVDAHGQVVAGAIRPPLPGQFGFERSDVLNLVEWVPWPRDDGRTGYVSQVNADGSMVRTVRYQGTDLDPIGWADENRIVARRSYPRQGSYGDAVLLNLETGEMNPIEGLRPTAEDRDSYVRGVATGEFAMVDAPGSCLHVRSEADAGSQSLGCFADGVLLEEVEGDSTAEWLPVRAPGGIEGFASTKFLVR
jgi:hypothetical protein